MLVLKRRVQEKLLLGPDPNIVITVVQIGADDVVWNELEAAVNRRDVAGVRRLVETRFNVRLGIDAPKEVDVSRYEKRVYLEPFHRKRRQAADRRAGDSGDSVEHRDG